MPFEIIVYALNTSWTVALLRPKERLISIEIDIVSIASFTENAK